MTATAMATQEIDGERGIRRVGVIGLGTMGAGIVEVFARAGLDVIGVESTPDLAERGRSVLEKSTARALDKGRLSEADRDALLARVGTVSDVAALADVDLVVEAVPESMDVKADLIGRLDAVLRPDAVIASNTSSLSVTSMAGLSAHPERVVGLHFFNPAPVLPLVEIITTVRTDDAVRARVEALATEIGKHPVVVGDRPGFVANYLLFGYLNRALQMLQRDHASVADIDTAMRVGVGLPMGPFTLMDLVGLDVCHHIGEVIYRHSRSRIHAPSTLLEQYVDAGRLGRKSGRGFYEYGGADTPEPEAVEPARSLAVLGGGEVAEALVSAARGAGLEVVHLISAEDAESQAAALAEVPIVIEAGTGEASDLDAEDAPAGPGDGAPAILSQVSSHLAPEAVIACANGESALGTALLGGRPERAVSLTVHEATAAGQVIEIGRTAATRDDAVALLRATVRALGAEPVVSKDRPGLVVDALLVPHLFDAVEMVDSGYASPADVDAAARFGLGYPVGPFAMIDAFGTADLLAAAEYVLGPEAGYEEPPALLVEHALLGLPFGAEPDAESSGA